jgi:hypothetical protein
VWAAEATARDTVGLEGMGRLAGQQVQVGIGIFTIVAPSQMARVGRKFEVARSAGFMGR